MNSHCHNGTINNEIAAQQATEIHKRIQPFAFVFCSFPFFFAKLIRRKAKNLTWQKA